LAETFVEDKMKALRISFLIIMVGLAAFAGADEVEKPFSSVAEAIAWVEDASTRMIQDSRREMPNGMAAYPPQAGLGYEAFWLRDYAYMLEGNCAAFSDTDLRDACRFFVGGIREDGSGVDCIKFDGTPIYTPGFGSMGENPVADGSQFTVSVAWHTYQKIRDRALLEEIIEALVKTMRACPRNPQTGLVTIDPTKEYDRCPYGFTDTVRKTGDVLFSSLLYVQAAGQLADLLVVLGRTEDAETWRGVAKETAVAVRTVFWDGEIGLFRAATVQCKEPDLWGSAFAVYLGVADTEQTQRIGAYFCRHYAEILHEGQLRHTPPGQYWEVARERDQYQNGGYWATPMGWFAYTLHQVDAPLAERTILQFAHAMRDHNFPEWSFGGHHQLPRYNASAALPLAGFRAIRGE
jgi:hypothetical protein